MATGKRKSTSGTKKTQTSRKANSKGKKTAKKPQTNDFTMEVILWIVVAISLLLFISNFGVGGIIGNAVSRFFFGIMGLIAYVFPIILLIGTFFAVSNKGNSIATVKLVAFVLFFIFVCMLLELFRNGSFSDTVTAFGAYEYAYENKAGGGLIGGFLVSLICPNFGVIGSYVIAAIVLIISFVLLTERSALNGVQKSGKRVYETAKINNEKHRELAEIRREERELRREEREIQREEELEQRRRKLEQRRMDRKVSGVDLDNVILPRTTNKTTKTDEVSEILPKAANKTTKTDEVSEIHGNPCITLPNVKEKTHVKLSSGGMKKDTEEHTISSVFSDEALAALSAMPEPQQVLLQDVPGRPDPASVSMPASEPADMDIFSSALVSQLDDLAKDSIGNSMEETTSHISDTADFLPQEINTNVPPSVKQQNPIQKQANLQQNSELDTEELEINLEPPAKPYVFPPIDLLKKGKNKGGDSKAHLQETALKLQQTLKNFGVNVTITNISCGPSVTRYEIQPEMGVKVSKIVNLTDDIKLNLAAEDIRMEAPIPGKAAIGIEVPNKETVMVTFRELIESQEFQNHPSKISFCVGKDLAGKVTVTDIAKMPHLLIAGATGSGKSVCINTIIMSILYKADPKDVKLIMVDPKVVELSIYNGIPHLMIPVVTDPKKAAGALHWAVSEMDDRYNKFAEASVRDLKGYNAKIDSLPTVEGEAKPEKLPQIVIIIDELADLMMVAAGDVEESICRLAQLARACGIHLIIATQRPSVNVITGLIKANMPSRIAFAVTSGIDSRTILDMNGAEKLLGKGDMLFNPQGVPKPLRVQGAFVSDDEVSDVVAYIKEQNDTSSYNSEIEEKMKIMDAQNITIGIESDSGAGDGRDAYFADAARLLMEKEKGSIGMLQRYFKVGFNRAARIMDQLEEAGIVGPEEGTKPRKVLMSQEQFEQYAEEYL